MKALFVDTAGWMACADAADPAHGPARAARDAALEAGRFLVTTDYVVDETLTLIRVRLSLAAAEQPERRVLFVHRQHEAGAAEIARHFGELLG